MDINIRQIRAFVAVARTGSFTRAADQLHLTQPALTVQIRRLEEALNMRLFDRTTRTVALNRTGDSILPMFERMLEDLGTVIDEARDVAAMKRGVVRIAALPSVAAAVLPRVIERFRSLHPGASFIVHDVIADRVIDRVRDGTVDIGITGGERLPPDLHLAYRMTEAFHAIVPSGHPLAAKPSVSRSDVAKYPLVALSPATSVRHAVDLWLRGAARMPVIACEATYMMTVAGMVSAGLGIALLPASARELIAFPDLVGLPVSSPPLTRQVSVVRLQGRTLTPMSETFCAHLIEALRGDG